jgi:hypothetical protein
MYAGFHSNLVETLKDKYGNALINKDVSIYFNGMNSILSTDHNGQVTLRISNVGPNTYNAAITFVGDDIYASATKTVKITVIKPLPKLPNTNKTISCTKADAKVKAAHI